MNGEQNFNNNEVASNATLEPNVLYTNQPVMQDGANPTVNTVSNVLSNNLNVEPAIQSDFINNSTINNISETSSNDLTAQAVNQVNPINAEIPNMNNIPNNSVVESAVESGFINNVPNIPQSFENPVISNGSSTSNGKLEKGKNHKLIAIIVVALLLVGGGIFAYITLGKDGKTANKTEIAELNSIFDPDKPIRIEKNDKYGYIKSDGSMLIEPQFDDAYDFVNDYAVVTVENPDKTSKDKILYQIIDRKGKYKLDVEVYTKPSYYYEYDLWLIDGRLYNSKLKNMFDNDIETEYIGEGYFSYEKSEESGIISYKGDIIYKAKSSWILTYISTTDEQTDELFAVVKTSSDSGEDRIISLKTGDVLFTLENSDDNYLGEDEDGLFYYYNQDIDNGYDNKTWLYFYNNKLAYKNSEKADYVTMYDYKNQILQIDYGYDYDEKGKSEQYYYYDVKNQKMLDQKPESKYDDIDLEDIDLTEITYGYKEMSESGNYGLMSGDKIIIPCEYDGIEYINVSLFEYLKTKGKEIVLLEKDGQTIIMNLKDKKAIGTIDSTYIYDYDNSTFIKARIYNDDGDKTYIYNLLTGKSIIFETDDDIEIFSNYIINKKDNKQTYYNTNLESIYVVAE